MINRIHAAAGLFFNDTDVEMDEYSLKDIFKEEPKDDKFCNETEFEDVWFNKTGRPIINQNYELDNENLKKKGFFNASEIPQGLENFTNAVHEMEATWEEDFKKWQE
jgi:hypothetical protein